MTHQRPKRRKGKKVWIGYADFDSEIDELFKFRDDGLGNEIFSSEENMISKKRLYKNDLKLKITVEEI